MVKKVAKVLAENGINATLINPLFINDLDQAFLENLVENHQVIATIEDGILDGGFGQKLLPSLVSMMLKF